MRFAQGRKSPHSRFRHYSDLPGSVDAGLHLHPGISSTGVQKPMTASEAECSGPARTNPGTIVLRPFNVSIDWLTLNMEAPLNTFRALPWDSLDPVPWWDDANGVLYHTEPTPHRTGQFSRMTYIMDDQGRKALTISHDPHQPGRRGSGWIQVQFANWDLYTGRWHCLYTMLREMGCTYSSVSRIDLACDGIEGAGGEWPQVMAMERHGKARYYGHCDWLTRHARARVIGGNFGTKGSNKFIRAYCKTAEMKRMGVKDHITAMWYERLGFNPMRTGTKVHRFEAQLRGKEIRRYFANETTEAFVNALGDPKTRVDIFASMAAPMFDFRTYASRARSARSVCSWDWTGVTDAAPLIAERAPRSIGLTDHTIKTGITAMAKLGIKLSDKDTLALARRYATAAGPAMLQWYETRLIIWMKQLAAIAAAGDPRALKVFYRLNNADPDGKADVTSWPRMNSFETLPDMPGQPPTE